MELQFDVTPYTQPNIDANVFFYNLPQSARPSVLQPDFAEVTYSQHFSLCAQGVAVASWFRWRMKSPQCGESLLWAESVNSEYETSP